MILLNQFIHYRVKMYLEISVIGKLQNQSVKPSLSLQAWDCSSQVIATVKIYVSCLKTCAALGVMIYSNKAGPNLLKELRNCISRIILFNTGL